MKILFYAQSSVLPVFQNLDKCLRGKGIIKESAYIISDSSFYFSRKNDRRWFEKEKIPLLFEWDFTTDAGKYGWNSEELESLEKKYGEPYLWNAIVCDRQLMYGRLCKVKQSYKGIFSHEQLCEMLCRATKSIDGFFDRFRPDCVINHVPCTFDSYLLYLVAKGRSVPYLGLKSTKIENFFTLSESIHEKHKHIYERYYKNLKQIAGYPMQERASMYLEKASRAPVKYEGCSIKINNGLFQNIKRQLKSLDGTMRVTYRKFSNPIIANDIHIPPVWGTYLYRNILKGIRGLRSRRIMARRRYDISINTKDKFVFYPLNSEPEVSLLIYGRDHQNQIETIRRLSQSIPLNWKLVIKEHPRDISYRTADYYRHLLEIPNVYFADPDISPFYLIQASQAVALVSGSVGLEAVIVGKPVIILGNVFYDILPETMVKKISSLSEFSNALNDLLKNYRKDDTAIRAFIAAAMSESVNINLYCDLFKREGRMRIEDDTVDNQMNRLADYTIKRIREVCNKSPYE